MSPPDAQPEPAAVVPPEPAEGAAEPGRTHFHAVLHPNRSLGRTGYRILMGVLAALNAGLATAFVLQGAWPIVFFLGLDMLLVYLAFRLSYRSGRLYEEVRLTDSDLVVQRVFPGGRRSGWRFEPYWLRVQMDDPPRHESQVRLVSHGRSVVVGAFLSPDERADFARALKDALARWRRPDAADAFSPAGG